MHYGRTTFESPAYKKVRDELHDAEWELRDRRERVAELRRRLPHDQIVEDYVFEEGPEDLAESGPARKVKLSELFETPGQSVVFYQFMFGGAQQEPCPMCTMWIDGLNGVAHHVRQRNPFAVVARAGLDRLREYARVRGWTNVRLLSAANNTMKRDLNFEDDEGAQQPGASVFRMGEDGKPILTYSVCAVLGEGEYRGLDLLAPVWHVFDLTAEGRGDWWPSLDVQRWGAEAGAQG